MFQINQECQPFAEELLTKPTSEYVYETYPKEDETTDNLLLYVDTIQRLSQLGTLAEVQMDRLSPPYYVRGEEPVRIKVTVKLGVHVFTHTNTNLPPMVGIFGQTENVSRFRVAFTKVYREKTDTVSNPLFPTGFKLHEQDQELLKRFPNMKKLRVDSIQGGNVRSAVLTGDMLEDSPEYNRYVKDSDRRGVVSYFGITVGDETVILSTNANMYSRQGKEARPVRTVYHILQSLHESNALTFFPTLDIF